MTDLQRYQRVLEAERLDREISELEGKAVTDAQKLAVLELRAEAVGVRLALAGEVDGGPAIEGKSVVGFSREKRRAFKRLLEDIGGFAPSGYAEDLLDFDDAHFERGMQLIRGEVEPDGESEEKALERWRAKT